MTEGVEGWPEWPEKILGKLGWMDGRWKEYVLPMDRQGQPGKSGMDDGRSHSTKGYQKGWLLEWIMEGKFGWLTNGQEYTSKDDQKDDPKG